MRGHWGKFWLATLIVTVSLICAPLAVSAADTWERGAMPSLQMSAQTSMEAQMLGEKPFQAKPTPTTPGSLLADTIPAFRADQDGGSALKLPLNLEMQISVHYNREPAALEPQKRSDSLLMQSSLDYRLLPNFKVGLNAYLYRPESVDNLSMYKTFGDRVMGLGPTLKYDLGHWSFLLKSQMETGNRDRGANSGLQSTVRVWYAF